MSKYTVDIGNGVMRAPASKEALVENTKDGYYDVFLKAIEKSGDGNYLGTLDVKSEEYKWLKYSQVKEIVANVGSALESLTKKNANVGIYSLNRQEWLMTELGCFRNSRITVPLYDTLGKEAVVHIIKETEMKLCVIAKNRIKSILEAKKEGLLESLETLVAMESVEDSLKQECESQGIILNSWEEFLEIGKAKPTDESGKSKNGDIFTICYTSGTSGMPKGVVLTHKNVLSIADAIAVMGKQGSFYSFSKNDIHLSYLPLAHVFERVLQALLLSAGAQVAFYRGDPLKILDDVKIIKPTIFVSVPRLFNRIYDKVWQGVNSKSVIAKFLFKLAYSQKKMGLGEGKVAHWLWDKVVFGNVRERLGFGRCQMMFSGSAPITADVMDFLRIVFCCEALEGFGQTESTAGVCTTSWGDTTSGHIGGPVPCTEVKLFDLPEMNYTSSDKPFPRGEICYRGSNAFVEYYKQPQKTKETIDSDGWVHTGDVGMWDDKGRLKIIDRAKNIFKLAQG
eukprot:NODE_319_length_9908_cov_1.288001.p1 type:complete len:509 gc:universal NODE_319_length_9908_cov_1.288001:2605-4131(+)